MKRYEFTAGVKFNLVAASLIIFAVLAVYLPTLKYDFVGLDDDILITDKIETLSDLSKIPSYFTKTAFYKKTDKIYRPLLTISFASDAFIMKGSPFIYHLTNIILHILCCICLFIFLKMLGLDKVISLLCALIFASHPAFAQAVAWIPGRNDTLLALWGTLSCIFLLRYAQDKKQIFFALSALFYAAALFTKETAVILFPVYFMLLFVFRRDILNKRIIVKILSVNLVITAIYLAARFMALSNTLSNMTVTTSTEDIFKALPATIKYLEYFLIPANIRIFQPLIQFDYNTALTVVLICVFAVLSFYLKNTRKQVLLFGILWFFIFLLPTYVMHSNQYYAHRLYFAAFGLIIVFIEVITALLNKYPITKKYVYAALVCVIVLFGVFTRLSLEKFENKRMFWACAVSETPESEIARQTLGVCFMEAGNYEEAEKELLKALQISPKSGLVYSNLGALYLETGRLKEAEAFFLTALNYNKYDDVSYYNLAQIYFIQGKDQLALENIEKALTISPEPRWYKDFFNKVQSRMHADQSQTPG